MFYEPLYSLQKTLKHWMQTLPSSPTCISICPKIGKYHNEVTRNSGRDPVLSMPELKIAGSRLYPALYAICGTR